MRQAPRAGAGRNAATRPLPKARLRILLLVMALKSLSQWFDRPSTCQVAVAFGLLSEKASRRAGAGAFLLPPARSRRQHAT